MLHHISIPAEHPQRVAKVLAELMNGCVMPFPPHPGSYVALACDEYGTLIEVYPFGTELIPGQGQQQVEFSQNGFASSYGAVHVAISVPVSAETIEQIAEREGWRSLRCSREGFFEVIELWIEDTLMVELLPPSIAPQYLAFASPENIKRIFEGEPVAV